MAEGRQLTKNQAALHYLIRYFGSNLGRTRLMKAMYLADLYSVQAGHTRVSSYQFVFHDHGPFAQPIYNDVEKLEAAELVKERRALWKLGPVSAYESRGPVLDYNTYLSSDDMITLAAAGKRASEGSLDELLKEVYTTKPMVDAAAKGRGSTILFVADRSDNAYVAPSPERIARSIEELDRGEGKDAREVLNALRARHLTDRRSGTG